MLLYCSFSALSLLIICRAVVLVFSQRLMLFLYWKKSDALNEAVQGHLFLLFPSPHPLKSTEFEGVLLMEKDMKQYVLSLLENYPQMIRRIELMRYELRFTKAVTPQEIISEALEKYMGLLREQDQLLHYVNLLSAREREIITAYYFDQRSWSEISKSLGISPRTAYAIRSQAIDELVTMYSYANQIFAVE